MSFKADTLDEPVEETKDVVQGVADSRRHRCADPKDSGNVVKAYQHNSSSDIGTQVTRV